MRKKSPIRLPRNFFIYVALLCLAMVVMINVAVFRGTYPQGTHEDAVYGLAAIISMVAHYVRGIRNQLLGREAIKPGC